MALLSQQMAAAKTRAAAYGSVAKSYVNASEDFLEVLKSRHGSLRVEVKAKGRHLGEFSQSSILQVKGRLDTTATVTTTNKPTATQGSCIFKAKSLL
jgi:hypothetical protein